MRYRQDMIFAMLDRIGSSEKILRGYPHKRLCDQARCIITANGSLLYSDDSHRSEASASYVQPDLEPIFAGAADPGAQAPPQTTGR